MLALDDQLVFSTTGHDVVSVRLSNGRERWTARGDVSGLPSADEKRIYWRRATTLQAVDQAGTCAGRRR
jgi:hypothetical protein